MIDSSTKFLGLIANPIKHSLSPKLHNYVIEKKNLNYIYLPLQLNNDRFEDGIKALRAYNFRGINVSIPYKKKIIEYLDYLDPIAQKIGAVNTVLVENDKLKGYNTDAAGFKRMLEEDGNLRIKNNIAIIVGAGGAARAVATVFAENSVKKLYIINRSLDRAEVLSNYLKIEFPRIQIENLNLKYLAYKNIFKDASVLVDTTPVGTYPDIDVAPVIRPDVLHENLLVIDLVYNPQKTTLLKAADKAGASFLNGFSMLKYQAAESFKIWTGYKIDPAIWNGLF